MEKTKIITFGTISTALLILFSTSKSSHKLADKLFNQWKGVKEDDKRFFKTLFEFWLNLGYNKEKAIRYIKTNIPWSAAFISYIMIKGGKTNFPTSSSHTCFAIKIKTGRYKGLELKRINDYSPKVGDIVIKNRGGSKLTFDSFKCGDYSHSDIVTKVLPYKLITVGGNVGNAISQTIVRTNKEGKILNRNYFAIIKVN